MQYNKDDYMNAAMAIGTTQDRSTGTRIKIATLFDQITLMWLYVGDGFARRLVDLPADECTRCGFTIEGNVSPEKISKVEEKLKDISIEKALNEAMKWRSCFGGSGIILGINDGGKFEEPLNENRIKDVEFLRVVDRYDMTIASTYDDPQDKRYGKTKIWTIHPEGGGSPYDVHESRVLILDGESIPRELRDSNDGWGMSKLQVVYDQLVRLGMSYQHVEKILERAQQAILGIPKLSEYIQGEGGKAKAVARAEMVDKARAITNTIVKDAEETYEIISSSFTNLNSVLDKFDESLCTVGGIPVTIFMQRSPGGMNSTGESDERNWHSEVGRLQRVYLLSPVERIVDLIMKSFNMKDDFQIEFNPLRVMTEKEEAELKDKKADTAKKYVDMESLTKEEVRAYLKENSEYKIIDSNNVT